MDKLPLLDEILRSRKVTDAIGVEYPLNSEVDEQEGELLSRLASRANVAKTLEVGCAYGISSLYICGALSGKESPSHTIIDPFQHSDWHGIGVNNLRRSGIDFYNLIEEPSEYALPRLCQEGHMYDLILIDGNHTLDHTLVDFFYASKLLNGEGVILIDDLTFPGIKKVIRYVLNYPCYEVIDVANPATKNYSLRHKAADGFMKILYRLFPKNYASAVFADSWVRSDYQLGVACSMVAFQKNGPDNRPWNWYEPF